MAKEFYIHICLLLATLSTHCNDLNSPIWSKKSSPLIDQERVQMFKKILRLYDYYFRLELKLPRYSDNKKLFNKIKKHCDLIKQVDYYIKDKGEDNYKAIYKYGVYNGKPLRTSKCYGNMLLLYEWLSNIEPNKDSSESSEESSSDSQDFESSFFQESSSL